MDSQSKIFEVLHKDPKLLYYLRMNPRWYRILYRNPAQFDAFMAEAKYEQRVGLGFKIEDITKDLNMLSMLWGTLTS